MKKEKATVCVDKVCATVEGDAAKIVNIAAVVLSITAVGHAINKLIK